MHMRRGTFCKLKTRRDVMDIFHIKSFLWFETKTFRGKRTICTQSESDRTGVWQCEKVELLIQQMPRSVNDSVPDTSLLAKSVMCLLG